MLKLHVCLLAVQVHNPVYVDTFYYPEQNGCGGSKDAFVLGMPAAMLMLLLVCFAVNALFSEARNHFRAVKKSGVSVWVRQCNSVLL